MYWFVVSKVACMAMADHQGDLTGTGKSGSSSIYEKERLPIQYSFQNPAVSSGFILAMIALYITTMHIKEVSKSNEQSELFLVTYITECLGYRP